MKRAKLRARNLTDSDIDVIVGIVDGWVGQLTWNGLISAIQLHTGVSYTRQALHRHERIRMAHMLAVERLKRDMGRKPAKEQPLTATEMSVILERHERLKAELERVKIENERLLQQFAVWAVNAHQAGLSVEHLNRPLPNVNRYQTPSDGGTPSGAKSARGRSALRNA